MKCPGQENSWRQKVGWWLPATEGGKELKGEETSRTPQGNKNSPSDGVLGFQLNLENKGAFRNYCNFNVT